MYSWDTTEPIDKDAERAAKKAALRTLRMLERLTMVKEFLDGQQWKR
jgi:hypothetical protein